MAKLYFELGDYQQSEVEGRKLVQTYETSPYVDDAMLLIAQSLGMRDGMHAEAAQAYQALVERFPDSEFAPHALFELGKLKAEANENEEAIAIWVQALKHHPDAQGRAGGHRPGAQAHHRHDPARLRAARGVRAAAAAPEHGQ